MNKPGFIALQQASQWYAQLCELEGDHEHHHHWQRWMDESEENRCAWEYVRKVSQRFQPLRGDSQQPAINALLHQPADMNRRRALKLAALLSTGSLLSWATYRYTPLRGSLLAMTADHHSATGEIKRLVLQDGTRLWLNTASVVDVQFDSQRRQLVLLAGDIMVDTAADPRPLSVSSAEGQMLALGTRFSVEQHDGTTHLAVYKGAVEVTARHAQAARRVDAGQRLEFNFQGQGRQLPTARTDADWSRGLLQADNLSLGEVIAQLSRYRHGYLACQPDVAALRVMGTFPLTDTDAALAMLAQTFPIRIHRRFSWWVTVEKK
ncbi:MULTISPECIES: FecR domain-containing protein [unclassified Brenneria]|uniref:FecR domain-containing protein n=1 Tax=unclassified Brenneria TaxID=2634434 RepID=UPI0018F0B517|nr:FecR domain-containing protein [Brenneria sp. L3-3C-1]MBJ7222620.1 FecR domain-containing protein [Brenneria sp. L3-3C-1]MEE3643863.1 FecR domain-containing protein [Brenneria sp. L3_3C_1]